MAKRAIVHADIIRGRRLDFTINDSGSSEIVALQNILDEIAIINEELIKSEYQVEDGTQIIDQQARKMTIEFTFSENVTADILAISLGAEIVIETSSGGTNGTGVTLTMASCDDISAFVSEGKTKIIAIKTVADPTTHPYTITANAV